MPETFSIAAFNKKGRRLAVINIAPTETPNLALFQAIEDWTAAGLTWNASLLQLYSTDAIGTKELLADAVRSKLKGSSTGDSKYYSWRVHTLGGSSDYFTPQNTLPLTKPVPPGLPR